jgi:hypothetical protein
VQLRCTPPVALLPALSVFPLPLKRRKKGKTSRRVKSSYKELLNNCHRRGESLVAQCYRICYHSIMDMKLFDNPNNVRFEDLLRLCAEYFGEPRIAGSHHIFKMPWAGDPRINIQKDGKMAKPYQVKAVKRAIEKLTEVKKDESKK